MPFSKFLVFMVYKFRDHSPYFTISERMFQELLCRRYTQGGPGVTVHRPYSAKSKLHENAILRDLQALHREACYCERSEQ